MPISTMSPRAGRAAGSDVVSREAMTNRHPAGKDSASSVIASMHSGLVIASASSRNQRHGLAHRRDRGREQRDDGDRRAGEGQLSQYRGCDPLDLVQGRREIGQQNGRIVVAVVGRDPGNPRLPALGPMRQQGCLAVARGREQRRSLRVLRPSSTARRARAGPRFPADRPARLRLQQREAGHHPPRTFTAGADMTGRGRASRHSAATYLPRLHPPWMTTGNIRRPHSREG